MKLTTKQRDLLSRYVKWKRDSIGGGEAYYNKTMLVLDNLLLGYSIDNKGAAFMFHSFRLSDIIHRLRKSDIAINTKMQKNERSEWGVYIIPKEDLIFYREQIQTLKKENHGKVSC